MPLERDPSAYDAHENIALPALEALRDHVKREGLWAPQMPRNSVGLA
jgi:acyl-CoA dehydrogenase